jgi:hypothetical protein
MIVAPISIGDGAKTGAGAVVTRDVPPGKLAVGMPARMREPRRASSEGSAPGGGQPPTTGQGPASEQAADAEAAEPPPAIEGTVVAAPSSDRAPRDSGQDP